LSPIAFGSKVVLEVGPGPGGNLLHVVRAGASRAIGIDISSEMLALAAQTLREYPAIVDLRKTDGSRLPLGDKEVDVAFTVTVLQHNTNTSQFQRMVAEICRVTRETVYFIEDTGTHPVEPSPDDDYVQRSVEVFVAECRKHGFEFGGRQYLGLRASKAAYEAVTFCLVPASYQEGEPFGKLPIAALKTLLTVTRPLDDLMPHNTDLTKMVFERKR
jgi:ubiquinone/menaquinone biosynthesis C-methylase UbiE